MALVGGGVRPGPGHDDQPTHACSVMMRSSLPTSNIGILGKPGRRLFLRWESAKAMITLLVAEVATLVVLKYISLVRRVYRRLLSLLLGLQPFVALRKVHKRKLVKSEKGEFLKR